jgi:hypothetical protein
MNVCKDIYFKILSFICIKTRLLKSIYNVFASCIEQKFDWMYY